MSHSTLGLSDYQYITAFHALFPVARLAQAVAARRRPTRDRRLPLWLLPAALIAWFWHPDANLPALLRLFRSSATPVPSDPAVYQARRRLGWAPLRWLRRHLVGPLADPDRDPTAFYCGRRLLAPDGTTFTAPDTPANGRTFGRPRNQHRAGGYPLVRAVAVCELGTHALIDWVARGYHRSEVALARRLVPRVPPGVLLLADRNFHAFGLWQAAVAGRFDLLVRVQAGPRLPVEEVLADGSYLTRVYPRGTRPGAAPGVRVRVVGYRWAEADGRPHESRLATTLLDPRDHPADRLVGLYHARWEQELAFAEVKGQLAGRVTHVRAHDPIRAVAELDGLLMGHRVTRWVQLEAARAAGIPPVRVSFTGTVRVLRAWLGRIPDGPPAQAGWWAAVLAAVGRERLRPRRDRRCPRARKCTRSHWPVKKPGGTKQTIPKLTVIPQTKP